MATDEVYYFAFGSNMNADRMTDRKVYFTERKCAKLSNYELKLHKVLRNGTAAANIIETKGHCVYGALYRCTEKGLFALDKYEGVRNKMYERKTVNVELSDGSVVKAVTYIALKDKTDDNICKVGFDYLQHILKGRDILPNDYVDWIEKTFTCWCVDAPCKK
ncbi:gamma-glutamylcyclotransferase-like [Clytia hemisphaerica]